MLPLKAYRNLPLSLQPGFEKPLDAYYSPFVEIIKGNGYNPNPDIPTYIGISTFVGEDGAMVGSASPVYPRNWDGEDVWQYEKTKRLAEFWAILTAPVYIPPPPTRMQRFKKWLHNKFVRVV